MRSEGKVNMVAVSPVQKDAVPGLPVEQSFRADFKSVGVRGTPTLVAVDSKGIVKKVWQGYLTQEREQEVLAYFNVQPKGGRKGGVP